MIRFFVLLLLLFALPVSATLKIAVASNFRVTLDEIVTLYNQQSKQKILVSSASTGVLYNQINHGAPFDLFLSADSERALLIEQSKFGINNSRFTYATGALAFWYPQSTSIVDKHSLDTYKGRISIGNPKLAPYGFATKQFLQNASMWDQFDYVKGNNISQAYQFIDSGNVAAGFVAYTALLQNKNENYYLLPSNSYPPILQQGVMLTNNKNRVELQHFVDFLQSESIVEFIRSKGYL